MPIRIAAWLDFPSAICSTCSTCRMINGTGSAIAYWWMPWLTRKISIPRIDRDLRPHAKGRRAPSLFFVCRSVQHEEVLLRAPRYRRHSGGSPLSSLHSVFTRWRTRNYKLCLESQPDPWSNTLYERGQSKAVGIHKATKLCVRLKSFV